MQPERTQKVDLVWAAVFLSGVSTLGLTLLFAFGNASGLERATAALLILAWMLAVLGVVLLLTVPGAARGLLVGGRVLIWTVFLALALAALLGVLSVVGVG